MTTPSLKEALFKKQHGLCWICCRPMNLIPGDRRFATYDHLVPRNCGGVNRPGNKLLAHSFCNHLRGDRPVKGVKLKTLRERALNRIHRVAQQHRLSRRAALATLTG